MSGFQNNLLLNFKQTMRPRDIYLGRPAVSGKSFIPTQHIRSVS